MIIKCPECQGQVSTMAGTCPHCGTRISDNLRTCPSCGSYCLISQDTCPKCQAALPPCDDDAMLGDEQGQGAGATQKHGHGGQSCGKEGITLEGKTTWLGCLIKSFFIILIVGFLCTNIYYCNDNKKEEKEKADYERLAEVTNPDFYQQFLDKYPESEHCGEIRERMIQLQKEAGEWETLTGDVSRANVVRFMQSYPQSLRIRLCEDMLDSIDWHDAEAIGSEEAITDYLSRHPSGRFAAAAAEMKNAMLLAKVTPDQRAMIRGTLESFFSLAIAKQDIAAARAAIPDSMISFCGTPNADAEAIVGYARSRMAKDVIGLHYLIGQQMNVRKETLPDGSIGFAVDVDLQETISRSDTNQPTSSRQHVNALISNEQKIVHMNITKE